MRKISDNKTTFIPIGVSSKDALVRLAAKMANAGKQVDDE